MFNSDCCLNSTIDAYAFGVTVHKILYGEHFWGKIESNSVFMQKLMKGETSVLMVPEKLKHFGVSEVLNTLTYLSLQCISKNQKERPSLFYLSIMFSMCKFYLTSLVEFQT